MTHPSDACRALVFWPKAGAPRFQHVMKIISIFIAVFLATASAGYAGKPIARDGSTKDKAIPLKQRGLQAIEEEMAWMLKVFHYTPFMATRDIMAEAIRKARATKKSVHPPKPWQHATLEHGWQWCSYWMVRTPRGERHIYFDTGISTKTPGEVVRQESSRAQYMSKQLEALKPLLGG